MVHRKQFAGVLFTLILTNLQSLIKGIECPANIDICEWLPWQSWSDCNRSCGGGTRIRDRYFCCKASLPPDERLCMEDCGLDYDVKKSGFHDSGICNSYCYNGGTYAYGHCRCPDRFKGTCCSDVVTCGRPSSISYGSFFGSDFTYGGRVRYSCYGGYKMVDSSKAVRTCTKYGYWSGSTPICLYAVSCNSSPCKNGANCINLLGDYRCSCNTGWTGKNCEVDIQPPVVSDCPLDRNIRVSSITTLQSWTEPNIYDPHGTRIYITKNYVNSSNEFPWGDYMISYNAVKPSNGLEAECKFKISVKPFPCTKMNSPANGISMCNGWRKDYSQICVFTCKMNYTLPPGFKTDDIYVCGASGNWLPTKPVLQCISRDMFPNTEDGKFSTCTSTADKKALAELYIQRLRSSQFNALCLQYPIDCIESNVIITC